MSKSDFVQSLQEERLVLSPFDVSQRLRAKYGFLSAYRGDAKLDIRDFRGYMVRFPAVHTPTPENPELYVCVISTQQPQQMQNLVWTKEIIGILDKHWTTDKVALGYMLDCRVVTEPHSPGTPGHVIADKDGFTLALGCTVPRAYRTILRREKVLERNTPAELEALLPLPLDLVQKLLDPAFEADFEARLLQCDAD